LHSRVLPASLGRKSESNHTVGFVRNILPHKAKNRKRLSRRKVTNVRTARHSTICIAQKKTTTMKNASIKASSLTSAVAEQSLHLNVTASEDNTAHPWDVPPTSSPENGIGSALRTVVPPKESLAQERPVAKMSISR